MAEPVPAAQSRARFAQVERARWAELDQLVARGERPLSWSEARRLGELYRSLASALLRSRRCGVPDAHSLHHEELMRQAYTLVYEAPRKPRLETLWSFYARDFPGLVRRELAAIGLAASVLMLGASAGAAVMHYDPAAISIVVPDMHQEQTPAERVRDEAASTLFDPGGSAVFSSFLFTHNIQVTFLVFALGLTAGIGSAAVLFWNGIPLGALAVQYVKGGEALFFAAWILPHGGLELSVVAIAGGAGFILARGLLRPGMRTRRGALYEESRTALPLVLGGMPLLVLAGLVEGTLSQLHPPRAPIWLKLTVAALLALGLFAYLGLAGRSANASERSARTGG